MDRGDLAIFALNSTRGFAEQVCRALAIPLSEHEERDFEDGEHKTRPLVNVRNRDVFVLQSLYDDDEQSVNDKLCRLLFFLGAVRDASAAHVTAVVPYLCYARKDRKTKARDPVTTRYIARLFESVGVDRVVTLEVHNLAAFQNAFSQPTDHLDALKLFVEHFGQLARQTETVVVSPDTGGIKRATAFRDALSRIVDKPIATAFMEKHRSAGIVSGETLVGDVQGKVAIMIDDLISSGTTLSRAAKACRDRGVERVLAVATHGVFVGNAESILSAAELERIVVTDSIPLFRLSKEFVDRKLNVIGTAPLFAEAIRRIHDGRSLVELLDV